MPAADGEFHLNRLRGKPGYVIRGAIEESGLVAQGDRGVVLVSGGADSVALLLGLESLLGGGSLVALHVNYGLREEAGADEILVRQICGRLGVELLVCHAGSPVGNTQAWARKIRLDEAEKIRTARDLDWIAIGHNRTDQAETFLYRLVSSPGARSLLAMPPRSGHIIRPLLGLDRGSIRRMLEPVAPWAEDATNDDMNFARNRIRRVLLGDLSRVNPRAELNVTRTRAELSEDEEALVAAADAVLSQADRRSDLGLDTELVFGQHSAVRRRMLRRIAEIELDRPVVVSMETAAEVIRLAGEPEGGKVDLGGGDFFEVIQGRVRVRSGGGSDKEELPMPVSASIDPGTTTFGGWEILSSEVTGAEAKAGFGSPWEAFIDRMELTFRLVEGQPGADDLLLILRTWQEGDRVEPLGMAGSKKLQDVFTDSRVPASRRRSWPVVAIGGQVIWVPGLVRSRHLLVGDGDEAVLRLQATPPFPI